MDEKDFIKELTEATDRSKSNTKRLDKLEKQQETLNALAASVQVLAEKEQTVEADVKEIKSDVKNITSKPAKRWESVIDKAILAVITGLIAYILYKLGIHN